LAALRDRFYVPEGATNLDGNSLGLLSREAEQSVLNAVDSLKFQGINGWLAANPSSAQTADSYLQAPTSHSMYRGGFPSRTEATNHEEL
jgi:kynureninase